VFWGPNRLLPSPEPCCCRLSKRLPPNVVPENRLEVCAGAEPAKREDPKDWVGTEEVTGGNSEGRWTVEEGEAELGVKPVRVSWGLWGAGSEERGRVCDLLSGVPKVPAAGVDVPPKKDMPEKLDFCGAGTKHKTH
jgi:hypothetical protein